MVSACNSVGNLGIVTRPTVDGGALLKSGRSFQELGFVEGSACRHFILAIIPFGDSAFSTAVEEALGSKGGDALINSYGHEQSLWLYSYLQCLQYYMHHGERHRRQIPKCAAEGTREP